MSAPVDVLAVVADLVAMGNLPRSTGLLANRQQFRKSDRDGQLVLHRTPTTATVLRALKRAERDGLVACVGTGAEHNNAWNKSAASERECYWQATDAALARCKGALA